MYPSSDQLLNYEDNHTVAFFTAPFEPFDNFSAHTINIWGKEFKTAEHTYQWKKFSETDPDIAERIAVAGSPWLVKRISHANSNRLAHWDAIKVQIMKEIIVAKVAQHEDLREMLLQTGNKTIVKNSPIDSFWGIGSDGKGKNMMGEIFMEVRDQLSQL